MTIEERIIEKDAMGPEKELFGPSKRRLELANAATEHMESRGIKLEKPEKFSNRFLKEIYPCIDEVLEKYPQLEGFITTVKAVDLPEGVMAMTGPYLDKKGQFAGAIMNFSTKEFGKEGYELGLVDLESELNWRGERWLGGRQTLGIVTHESAHAMALLLNAEDAGIHVGEKNHEKYEELKTLYGRNSRIISLCYESMKDLNISPRDIGREISTYAESDWGECFAEAISRHDTCKNPGKLSTEIHNRYVKLVEERKKAFNGAIEKEAV